MPLQHVVNRGDSLWGLAGRHLGNFARWPELLEYHNEEILKSGGNNGRVFSIKDPNVIYVGQI
jgi:nucleoid-associated protein YgaU